MDGIVETLDIAVGETDFRHFEFILLKEFLTADLREDALNGISSKDSLPKDSCLLVAMLKLFRTHFNSKIKGNKVKICNFCDNIRGLLSTDRQAHSDSSFS